MMEKVECKGERKEDSHPLFCFVVGNLSKEYFHFLKFFARNVNVYDIE